MTKRAVSSAFVMVIALGLAVIIVAVLLLTQCSEAFGATLPPSTGSITEFALTHSLSSGPLTPMYHRWGPLSPGPGSYCGTLSLTYICRRLAIEVPPIKIARLINDRGTGVSMLDLARAARSLGLKAEGLRTDLAGLKTLPQPVIAFLPHSTHFVVVLKANDKGVTCIDLTGPNTLAWYSPEEFACEWNGEIMTFGNTRPGLYTPLDEAEMAEYVGGGCGSKCTKVIQEEGIYKECENIVDCFDTEYMTLFKRYGCEPCTTESSCTESSMARGYEYPCKRGNGPSECEPDLGATPTLWGSISACG